MKRVVYRILTAHIISLPPVHFYMLANDREVEVRGGLVDFVLKHVLCTTQSVH